MMNDELSSFISPILSYDAYLFSQVTKWSHLHKFRDLDLRFKNAISIGCGNGWESIALSLYLGISECLGIDSNEDKIEVANRNLSDFERELDLINAKLRHLQSYLNSSISIERELEEKVRLLFDRYMQFALPKFICADISEVDLNDDISFEHFDFVYCRHVIYHIFCDKHDTKKRNTERSISLISELTKSGGIVVSIEPETCSEKDRTAVTLHDFFIKVGFDQFTDDRLSPLPLGTMLYRKT